MYSITFEEIQVSCCSTDVRMNVQEHCNYTLFTHLPLTTLAELSLMNKSLKCSVMLVNISGHF